MKKLLLLLFSLLLSTNSFGEGVCYANWNPERFNISVFDKGVVDVNRDELLSVCEEGDILLMGGFAFSEMKNELFDSSRLALATIMSFYCELTQTHIIENRTLVCKLVDRDLN